MNYFPSPTVANVQAGVAFPTYLGNVATFGALNLGRSEVSYERAIAKLKAKIKKMKVMRKSVKSKIRKNRLNQRIINANKKLGKLQSYLKIKVKHKALKDAKKKKGLPLPPEPFFADEELLLTDAVSDDSEEMFSEDDFVSDDMLVSATSGYGEGGYGKLILGSVVLLGGLWAVSKLLAPKKNRVRVGKKSNRKNRKNRRNRRNRR